MGDPVPNDHTKSPIGWNESTTMAESAVATGFLDRAEKVSEKVVVR